MCGSGRAVIAEAFNDASKRLNVEIQPTLTVEGHKATIKKRTRTNDWRINIAAAAVGIAATEAVCQEPDSRQTVKYESTTFL